MEKTMPHSVEAEQSVLGSIILDSTLISLVSKKIETSYFYKEVHKIIFESMESLYKQGKKIDIILLVDDLRNKDMLEKIGGISYLTSLSSIVPSTSNIDYYLDILSDKKARRVSLSLLNSINDKILNENLESLRSDMESLKNVLAYNKKTDDLYVDASEIKRRDTSNDFLDIGIKFMNKMLGGGLAYSTLNVITGTPGSGKSTLINQIIAKAIYDNHKAFLYSGELRNDRLMTWFKRTVANSNHIIEKTNRNGEKYDDISNYCWDIISDWVRGKLKIYDKNSVASESNLLAVIEHLILHEDYKLFVLDNLMTIDIGSSEKQYQAQKQLCQSLKDLCDRYEIIVILVAHPKKPPKADEVPTMYDVAGASEIVNLADNIIRIDRCKRTGDDVCSSKILIQKNRWGGAIGRTRPLYFDEHRKRFYYTMEELNFDYGYDTNKQFEQVDTDEIPF